MRFRNWMLAASLLATTHVASALELYSVDVISAQLVRIDTSTLQGVYLGPLGVSTSDFDLTFHDGQLYGLVNDFQNVRLVTINTATGAIESMAVVRDETGAPVAMAEGLASDGLNLRLSFSSELGWSDRYGTLDPATGNVLSSHLLSDMGSILGRADIDGMAMVTGLGMFGVNGEQAYTEIFNLDLQTRIGVDFNQYVNDLWYESHTLFAIGGPTLVELRTYDVTNGSLLTVNAVTGLNANARLLGLAAVPEPGSILALATGSVLLFARRRK